MLMDSLREAVPYIRMFKGKTFVIKFGGEVLEKRAILRSFLEEVELLRQLGIKIVLVHGGGPQLSALMAETGLQPKIVAGRRVTDEKTLELAKMVFAGKLNMNLVSMCLGVGISAVGLTGADAGLVVAEKRPSVTVRDDDGLEKEVDFGLVGDLQAINPTLIQTLLSSGMTPVVCSLSADGEGRILNLNADGVAAALAAALRASKLFFVTARPGVLSDPNDKWSIISQLTLDEADAMVRKGAISGGMRPKLEAAAAALRNGVSRVHIIDGTRRDALIEEVFTNAGCGTLVVIERDSDTTHHSPDKALSSRKPDPPEESHSSGEPPPSSR
jgi:acetylglutamate kinase